MKRQREEESLPTNRNDPVMRTEEHSSVHAPVSSKLFRHLNLYYSLMALYLLGKLLYCLVYIRNGLIYTCLFRLSMRLSCMMPL